MPWSRSTDDRVAQTPPEVNIGQRFGVRVQISNTGGANLKNVSYSISSDGASAPQPPDTDVLVAPLIAGGAAVVDTFFVTADNTTGSETLTADVTGATDVNSNQSGLFNDGPDIDSTAVMQKVAPSVLTIDSVAPSQPTVTRNTTTDWYVNVAVSNTGGAPLDVVTPAPSDISFRIGGTTLTGYVVLAPTRFVEKTGLRLDAGESATLSYTVDVTGATTGTVTIRSDIDWRDANDLDVSSVQRTGTVNVVAPSGVFVNTTKADPATAPNSAGNSVRVDSGQLFTVEVNVQNLGEVEDVDQVQVRLTSNHPTSPINLVSEFAQILRGETYIFRFVDVSPVPLSPSAGTRTDLFTATIISARSMQSGDPVTAGQPVDNTESVIIEKPANLDLNAQASDNSVSTGQLFTVTGHRRQHGRRPGGRHGRAHDPSPARVRSRAGADRHHRGIRGRGGGRVAGEGPVLGGLGPADPGEDHEAAALAEHGARAGRFRQRRRALDRRRHGGRFLRGRRSMVSAPAGAMDDTVSTLQQFTLRASAIAEATTATIIARLDLVDDRGIHDHRSARDGASVTARAARSPRRGG